MRFSIEDWSYAFLSIVLEGVPFLLLGAVVSGLLGEFLPVWLMRRLVPRENAWTVMGAGALGMVFPLCECAAVPVVKRLIAKGLPRSCGLAWLLAAPIANPVVALSTAAAFRGQWGWEMAGLRVLLGWFLACLAGMAARNLPAEWVWRSEVKEVRTDEERRLLRRDGKERGVWRRFGGAVVGASQDFLQILGYFLAGAGVAAFFGTAVDHRLLEPLALQPVAANFAMMGLAFMMCVCSTSDAFIAATFVSFAPSAKLAFLVFGPMFDARLMLLYQVMMRRRFVLGLGMGLFVVTGLVCWRLDPFLP